MKPCGEETFYEEGVATNKILSTETADSIYVSVNGTITDGALVCEGIYDLETNVWTQIGVYNCTTGEFSTSIEATGIYGVLGAAGVVKFRVRAIDVVGSLTVKARSIGVGY